MQSKNKLKDNLKNYYSNLGAKKLGHQISLAFFYDIKIPSILLEKSGETISSQNSTIH